MINNNLEIYIHIPFCVKKCAYCDFLSGPATGPVIESYAEALIREIRAYGQDLSCQRVTSIFFGGGTPSILEGECICRIMEALRETFLISEEAEISIEANPGTVTPKKLAQYKEAGVNRISFGLQSTVAKELTLLGRIHTYEDFLSSYHLARKLGFDNINVDLISAIPGQTKESWEESLMRVASLQPEHISAYSLIIEEGTPFYQLYGEGADGHRDLPSEETEREMYRQTRKILEAYGYHRYEISNYAKPGRECRHNLGYWERKEYLGMGLGASSLIGNTRYKNTDQLSEYMDCADTPRFLRREIEVLSLEEQMEEFVFLGLRKMEGISLRAFQEIFKRAITECYGPQLESLKRENLVSVEGDFLRLTDRGIDVSNYVFGELLFCRSDGD